MVTVGEVAAASALTIRRNGMSGRIMWLTLRLFDHAGTIREGLRSISVPHEITDVPGAPVLSSAVSRSCLTTRATIAASGRAGSTPCSSPSRRGRGSGWWGAWVRASRRS